MKTHPKPAVSAFAAACAMFALATPTSTATMSASTTAPAANGLDIANYAATNGTNKWFVENTADGSAKGQTFTTGPTEARLKSISYRSSTNSPDGQKTYVVRVGTVSGTTFTQIHAETMVQNFPWYAGQYMTWTFAEPVLLAPNTTYAIDVGMTASTVGWNNNLVYIYQTANTYAGGGSYTSGTSGVGTNSMSFVANTDRLFHLDLQHPLNPSPDIGATVPAGDLALSWTNLAPATGSDVWVDVWFGTNPNSLTKVAATQQNLTSFLVNLPGANTYYWRIDSYLDGAPTGTPVQSTVFNFIVTDSDSDGFPDAYELANTNPPSATALNTGDDLEPDGLTNWQEFQLGTSPSNPDSDGDGLNDGPEIAGVGSRPATDPTKADTDDDGLSDGVESNSGTWAGATNPGTNPAIADTDSDALKDGVETNTGTYLSTLGTGTNPLSADTDGDGARDWYEVVIIDKNPALGGQPNSPNDPALKPNVPYPLPAYDGSSGVTNKPVKVYILSGQSNMLGYGTVNGNGTGILNTMVNTEGKFPHLRAAGGGWVERNDVHVHSLVDVSKNEFEKKKLRPDWSAASGRFGPELGFGTIMGWYHDEPVLLIKPSIGNRALGWDYLPPGSPNHIPTPPDTYTYAGYGLSGPAGSASLERWLTSGGAPGPSIWYAGKQFDDFFLDEEDMSPRSWATGVAYPLNCSVKHNGLPYISKTAHTSSAANEPGVGANWTTDWRPYSLTNVVDILDNFATQYPSWASQGFEISGYVWWQGHRDQGSAVNSNRYRQNMERFIKQIRLYYENRYNNDEVGVEQKRTKTVVNAPFVLATLDAGGWDMSGNALTVANAQHAVDGNAKTGGVFNYPEFTGNVKTVEARGFFRPTGPNGDGVHYFHNAEAYLLTGDALGRAMVELNGITPPGNTFASWMAGYPSVPPGLAGFNQDADGDGIDNGAENFFGTHPGIGTAGMAPGARSDNTFTFTHPQNANPATGVTGTYRWSKDLTNFHNHGQSDGDGTTVSFNAVTNAGITTVTATVTGTAAAKLFVDVKVTQN